MVFWTLSLCSPKPYRSEVQSEVQLPNDGATAPYWFITNNHNHNNNNNYFYYYHYYFELRYMLTVNYTEFGDLIWFGYVGMKTFCHAVARSNFFRQPKTLFASRRSKACMIISVDSFCFIINGFETCINCVHKCTWLLILGLISTQFSRVHFQNGG